MKRIIVCIAPMLIFASVFTGCSSKPSEDDIKKKILLDYVCAETATVNDMTVVSVKDAESIFGLKGFEYQVSGEIEWTEGCRQFGTGLPPGHKEKFQDRRVFLIKGEDDVWR